MPMTCKYLLRLYTRFLDLLKWAYFPYVARGLPLVFHGVRNLVPNLRVLPFFLVMPGGESTKEPMHCRIRRQILWEVICWLYHHLHRLIFMIWTQRNETGRNLSKLGRITGLPWSCTRNPKPYTQVATLLAVIGAEARNVFATFTNWASDTDQNKCYKSLQLTVSHLKKCLFKDTSFILECKNRESLTIIIGQLFGS